MRYRGSRSEEKGYKKKKEKRGRKRKKKIRRKKREGKKKKEKLTSSYWNTVGIFTHLFVSF